MASIEMTEYTAMQPYFSVITGALTGLVDGDNFFDMHAENVVVEYVITVPGYPRRVVGRTDLAALYRNYGQINTPDRQSRSQHLLRS